VASAAHKFLNGKLKKKLDFDTKMEGKSLSFSDSMDVYGMTKLCNILFTKSWAEKLKAEGSPLTCYSIHPGWVATDLSREAGNFIRGFEKMVARTPEEGAVPSLWCACEPLSNEHLVSGEYYTWIEEKGEKTRQAKDAALASWLYDWSLNLLSESLKP
jgi:NAD(P)-dependent dehydrogenase (short-subunit alcohol dehydrogenase family)